MTQTLVPLGSSVGPTVELRWVRHIVFHYKERRRGSWVLLLQRRPAVSFFRVTESLLLCCCCTSAALLLCYCAPRLSRRQHSAVAQLPGSRAGWTGRDWLARRGLCNVADFSDPVLISMVGAWLGNIVPGPLVNHEFLCFNWVNISLGIFIFLHGHYIHRMKFTTFRLFAELCAFGGMLTGVFNLTCESTESRSRSSHLLTPFRRH